MTARSSTELGPLRGIREYNPFWMRTCRVLASFVPAWVVVWAAVGSPVQDPTPGPRDRIAALFESAERAIESAEWEQAESDLQQLLGIALDQLGAIHVALSEFAEAERAYTEACRNTILTIRPFTGLGIVYLRTGQYARGIDLMQRILDINPTNAEAKHLLGKYFYMQGNFRAAARELRDAYSVAPDDTGVAYTLALAHLELREPERAKQIFQEILDRMGESAGLRLLFGRAYRETEHWTDAVAEFRRAIELDPDYPRAHYYLGLTYLLWEGAVAFEQAMREFLLELEHHPNQYHPNFFLGVIYTIQLRDQEALPYLQRAAELDPMNPDPHLYLGQVYSRAGRTEEAVASLRRSIELTRDPARNNYQISNTYYVLGQTLLRLGRREEAVEYVKKSQELKRLQDQAAQTTFQVRTSDGAGQSPQGMVAQDVRDLGESEIAVVLDEPPPDPEQRQVFERMAAFYRSAAANGYQQLARVKTGKNDLRKAVELLELALHWDSSLPNLRHNLAVARLKAGDFSGAAEQLLAMLAEHPEERQTQGLLAEVSRNLVRARQHQMAIKALDYLIRAQPQIADLWVLRGQAHAQAGNYDRSLDDFRQALARDASLPEAHYYSGMSLIRQGRLNDAVAEFELELARNPNHYQALYHKAFVLISQHQMKEAEPLLRRVIELQPEFAEAYYQLGKIQMDRDELLLAVVNLETATALDPSKSYFFYQLSRAYNRSGRRQDAEKALERYRELKKLEDARGEVVEG